MKKIMMAIVLALVTFMAALTLASRSPEPIDKMIVFGDSLSDTGTVFRATNGLYPPDPPYFQGRYSNGRVWIEYLADHLGVSASQVENFACGGAISGSQSNGLVPGLLSQVQTFLRTHPQIAPQALYVVWIGANDYLQGASDATAPAQNIITAIRSLSGAGATKLLVANLPDLGQLPATRTSASSTRLTAVAQTHNQTLRRSLKLLEQQQSHLQIMTLDANTLYSSAIANPAQFEFINVTAACVSGANSCPNPDQFLFWDGIHPTTATHQILGKQAFVAVEERLGK